ncbi:hypothetical protein J2S46_000421 [Kitasatospora herbaricolor]|nr:hypothetical protein [Kitasatospora herbaricolor]
MLLAFQDGFEAGAEGEGGLAGAGASAHGDDADLGVEEQVEGDALFGAASAQAEGFAVAADQADAAVAGDAAQGPGLVRR